MYQADFVSVLVDIDHTATGQFAGYDADRDTLLIDLGKIFNAIIVIVPTLTSATLKVSVCRNKADDEVPVDLNMWNIASSAIEKVAFSIPASTGDFAMEIPVAGIQFLRIRLGANQAADRTFYVRGVE